MPGPIPDLDHISRYCRPTDFDGGELQATAFLLKRAKQETSLSVNWLEQLSTLSRIDQIEKLRQVFARKFQVAATAKFAVLNAGSLRNTVKEGSGLDLTVLHEPTADDVSHAEINGIVEQDELVAELLLQTVIPPIYPAKEPKA